MAAGTSRLIPAGRQMMLPFILEALAGGAMTRDELLIRVDEIARKKNVFVDDARSIGKALAVLAKDGHVTNIQKGWWCIAGSDFPSAATGPKPLTLNELRVPVSREIGTGDQVTFFFDAASDGSKQPANKPVMLTVGTVGPGLASSTLIKMADPLIALAIYSDNAKNVAHIVSISAVDDASVTVIKASPYSIEVFYRSWLKASAALKKPQDQSSAV